MLGSVGASLESLRWAMPSYPQSGWHKGRRGVNSCQGQGSASVSVRTLGSNDRSMWGYQLRKNRNRRPVDRPGSQCPRCAALFQSPHLALGGWMLFAFSGRPRGPKPPGRKWRLFVLYAIVIMDDFAIGRTSVLKGCSSEALYQ